MNFFLLFFIFVLKFFIIITIIFKAVITTLSFSGTMQRYSNLALKLSALFVSFIIFSYALDENMSTGVSSELYDPLMQKWQQSSYCFMSRTSASICSDNSTERYGNVRFRCGKFPRYMLAEDQGLRLAATFSKGGFTSDCGFSFWDIPLQTASTPSHSWCDFLPIIFCHLVLSLINRLTFPVELIYH